jgi:hypothetical protein
MGDQYSALRVKLSDIVEGLEFQSDECLSYLNTATGEVVSITDEELRGFCRKFSFEVICGMISPYEQRRCMRESDNGDQF